MTAIALQPFDPVAEVRAILESIDGMLAGFVAPAPKAEPKAKPVKRGKAKMLGFTRVTWRKTACGFQEPVFTSPKTVESSKIDSLATYHKRLMAMGCEPVGSEQDGAVTVYRTPEGTVLKVRPFGGAAQNPQPEVKVSYCHGQKPDPGYDAQPKTEGGVL